VSHLHYICLAYDETLRQIAICIDDYKFVAFSYSILQEFAVNKEVTCMSHLEIVMALHSQRTGSYRVLRGIAFITDKLDISWDSDINLTFSGEDSTQYVACDLLNLPSPTMDPYRS